MQADVPPRTAANDPEPRPAFGTRYLTEDRDVWSHSAWDSVPPPTDQDEIVAKSLTRQRLNPVPKDSKEKYNTEPSQFWDHFYRNNQDNFFRDRKWLHREFDELTLVTRPNAGPRVVVEVGCGAGNAAFPLLASNENPELHIHACDYAPTAVEVVKQNPLYTSPAIGRVSASVWDLSSSAELPEGIRAGTVDVVILIFVLSALSPFEWEQAITNVYSMLKPGGLALVRDYGRHDLTQLRFKDGRLLDENFYIRGDGTRVYFFEIDELSRLFTGTASTADQVETIEGTEEPETSENVSTPAPESSTSVSKDREASAATVKPNDSILAVASLTASLSKASISSPPQQSSTPSPSHNMNIEASAQPPTDTRNDAITDSSSSAHLLRSARPPHPLFVTEQLRVDRRLIVNRKRQLKMYRVWMQGQFRKPLKD